MRADAVRTNEAQLPSLQARTLRSLSPLAHRDASARRADRQVQESKIPAARSQPTSIGQSLDNIRELLYPRSSACFCPPPGRLGRPGS